MPKADRRARRAEPLAFLCAWLGAGLRGASLTRPQVEALLEPRADLLGLARLAGRHGVTPMLAAGVRDAPGGAALPDDFRRYLGFVHAENGRRNGALRLQLAEAAGCLNAAGIEPVLLKGAIRLVDGLYPDPGWRLMRDLDVLVPRDRLRRAAACLGRIGYAPVQAEGPRPHRHLPPLARPEDHAPVELHGDLLPRRGLCPAEDVIARSRPARLDGAAVRLPAAADQLVHLVAHDRLDDPFRRTGTIALRGVVELVLLGRAGDAVPEALGRFAAAGLAPWPRLALAAAVRLFPDETARWAGTLGKNRAARAQLAAILAVERWDRHGGARRVVGYLRGRTEGLVASKEDRRHLLRSLLSAGYYRRCRATLAQLWADR